MPKSTGQIEVLTAAENFLKVVKDVEKYPEFVSEMKKVEIHEQDDDGAKVSFYVEVSVGGMSIKTSYTLNYTYGDNEISWTLDNSENLTENRGSWKVEEVDEDECIAHYEAEIETNLPIPPEVQKMFADEELPKMLDTFRDRTEDLYD